MGRSRPSGRNAPARDVVAGPLAKRLMLPPHGLARLGAPFSIDGGWGENPATSSRSSCSSPFAAAPKNLLHRGHAKFWRRRAEKLRSFALREAGR